VVNEKGEKTAILLPIDEYEKILEDLHDLAVVAERSSEKIISYEEVKKIAKMLLKANKVPEHSFFKLFYIFSYMGCKCIKVLKVFYKKLSYDF
jgi:hypothetical protein